MRLGSRQKSALEFLLARYRHSGRVGVCYPVHGSSFAPAVLQSLQERGLVKVACWSENERFYSLTPEGVGLAKALFEQK